MAVKNALLWIVKALGTLSLLTGIIVLILVLTASTISNNINERSLQDRLIDNIVENHYEEASALVQNETGYTPGKEALRVYLTANKDQLGEPPVDIPREKLIKGFTTLGIILTVVGLLLILLGSTFHIFNMLFFIGLAALIGGIVSGAILFVIKAVLPKLITQMAQGNPNLPALFVTVVQEVFNDIFLRPISNGILMSAVIGGIGLLLVVSVKIVEKK